MKAIRISQFGGADVLKCLTDIGIPKPKANEVVIRVLAAGVNPVETYQRSGTYARLPTLPFTPGADAAGIVDSVGASVTKYQPGARVFTVRTESGSYAQYCTALEKFTFPLPDNITFSHGACLGTPYFTAYRALNMRANVKAGECIMVHGASGGVGLALVQMAKALGCRVIATAGSNKGLCLVKQNGADFAFNHNQDGYQEMIGAEVHESQLDVIFENLANINLQRDLDLIGIRGRIIVIGNRGSLEINPRAIMAKEVDVRGVMLLNATSDEMMEMGAGVVAGAQAGYLTPVIGQEFPIEEASQAHEQVIKHTGGSQGRIILTTGM